MNKTKNQEKLLKILSEMFQLDRSDLDFGIYRIMNSKSKEIKEFLDNDLLSSVSSAFSSNENNSIQKELDEAIGQAQALGADPERLPKVIELRQQLSSTTSSENLENDVFSHLANFFKRYYKDGDFVSLRRYKKDTYAIPYEGEEVKLHWANSDQYYIKSGEYFRDYSFKVNDKTIHFKLSDAQTESNNNKATSDKERRFVIQDVNPCEVIDNELYINFEYKAIGKENQEKLNEKAITKTLENIDDIEFLNALNTLAPTEKNKSRTIFEKHLKSYTSRNSFDYFIHKDLGGFMSRELDFYIKNEMLFLDDIMHSPIKYEEVMGKIKIFKEVAQKIITFLTQLEELQKRLWEKKKFVIETNYCITLDKIDEEYYEQIFSCREQLAEWKELFDIDIKSVDELKEEKYLVLDTKFFDMAFKYKLLNEFDNLDEELDGVLINSENFGALNLLQERYKEQVKTVYIDPPYNTKEGDFLYKDNYKHSSWMSMIQDRLLLMKTLINYKGRFYCSIDDRENSKLLELLYLHLGKENYLSSITWEKRTKSQNTKTSKYMLQSKVEYIHPFRFEDKRQEFNLEISGQKEYPLEDKIGKYRIQRAEMDSLDRAHAAISMSYPILGISPSKGKCWKFGKDTADLYLQENRIFLKDNWPYIIFRPEHEEQAIHKPFWSHFFDKDTYGTAESGLKILDKELGFGKNFLTVKPTELISKLLFHTSDNKQIILDYFAGSGTTGHSVINLNRKHRGKRKYILIEMGEYFEQLLKPRIQKVIYSDSWKDGKPTTKNGISQIFKYFKLESYEDTLNNLEFKKTEEQQKTLEFHPEAKEDYILNYSLDVESQGSLLNIDTFSTPFDYKLKIATSSVGETKDTNIDLVETFNYLLGLVVKRIELLKGYLVVEGQTNKKEKILIIWRDGQSSEKLNEFFKKMDWSVYDREFDTIYVNGDNNLDNLRCDEDHYKVKLIEQEFKKLMFGE